MNKIRIFQSPQFGEIRTAGTPEQPLFCLADVCKALGIKNHRNVKKRIDEEDVHQVDTLTEGGSQSMAYVNEAGLYATILRSDAETAKPFRKWVTSEVLPTIRRTGGYLTAADDETPEEIMARALVVANETIQRRDERIREQQIEIYQQAVTIAKHEKTISQQEATIKALTPQASVMQRIMNSAAVFTTTQVANQLGMTANELNKRLEECGIIYLQSGQWLLHAPYVRMNLHATRFVPITHSDGTVKHNAYTVWLMRGCAFIQSLQKNKWNTRDTLSSFGYVYTPETDDNNSSNK